MKLLICALASMTLWGQIAEKANENYKTEQARAGVARGLTSTDRDARQRPAELIAAIGLKPGMVVADIGTGPGYMLPHLSAAVGPSGKVLAEDIFPDYLKQARERAANLKNVEFIEGNERSVNLPAASADLALVLDVYHHLDYPKEVLASLAAGLKRDGRLAIVEYHQNDGTQQGIPPKGHVRLGADDAIKEIEAAGWKLIHRQEFIPKVQWIGIFVKQSQ